MTVVQRLVRRNFLLGGLAVVLLLVLVFRPAPTSALRPGELPELFPDLTLDAARTIVLERVPDVAGRRGGDAAPRPRGRGVVADRVAGGLSRE